MKQLVVLSGKGGTGKTVVSASLAHLASQTMATVLVDADVDAANLELVLDPEKLEDHEFRSGLLAVIEEEACTSCGRCADVCRFDAIVADEGYRVEPLDCEGCASCFYQCPAEAITLEEPLSGRWYRSNTQYGPLFHAHLFAGQENSGKLVTMVKQQGRLLALDEKRELIIIDGPPGIGCPVISACTGADLALLVAEPTVSGVHDLERVLATTGHFKVEALVLINKVDISPARADEVADYCRNRGVEVVGRVPYDDIVTEAMVHGQPVTAYGNSQVGRSLREVWIELERRLSG